MTTHGLIWILFGRCGGICIFKRFSHLVFGLVVEIMYANACWQLGVVMGYQHLNPHFTIRGNHSNTHTHTYTKQWNCRCACDWKTSTKNKQTHTRTQRDKKLSAYTHSHTHSAVVLYVCVAALSSRCRTIKTGVKDIMRQQTFANKVISHQIPTHTNEFTVANKKTRK